MYGLVNKAAVDLIKSKFGEEAWKTIEEKAGASGQVFLTMEPYPDKVTYQLVQAASETLDIPVDTILEAFGENWIEFTSKQGYGELLDMGGATLEEFLTNLDQLHGRVGLTLPDLEPPRFEVVEAESDYSYSLRYYSDREGLAPMVLGLLRGLAKKYGQEIEIAHEPSEEYDTFNIREVVAQS